MDVHMMAADLDRRFGGQNVFRYLAEGLSDNPNMTGVFDLSRNPSPCRGVGIGSEIAYKDVDARFGEPSEMGRVRGIGVRRRCVCR